MQKHQQKNGIVKARAQALETTNSNANYSISVSTVRPLWQFGLKQCYQSRDKPQGDND